MLDNLIMTYQTKQYNADNMKPVMKSLILEQFSATIKKKKKDAEKFILDSLEPFAKMFIDTPWTLNPSFV